MSSYSRRAVLMGLGAAGIAATTPGATLAQNPYQRLDGQPWFFLSEAEARFLAAAADAFIPADEYPSASQAGVVDFIDLQLAGPYGAGATLYLDGPFPEGATPEQGWQLPYTPAEFFRRAIGGLEDSGTRLADLGVRDREEAVQRLADGGLTPTPEIDGPTFADELWSLVKEGYFADPIYGGNRDYAGWKMVGFPGAHAYFLDFVEVNAPYPVQPRGISHVPGAGRSGRFSTQERG